MIGVAEDAGDHIRCLGKRVDPRNSRAGNLDPVADPEPQRLLKLLLDGALPGFPGQAAFQKLRQRNLLRQGLDRDARFRVAAEDMRPGCPDGLRVCNALHGA